MKNIVIFERDTGRIVSSGQADPKSLVGREDCVVTERYSATYDATHYVLDGALAPRPVLGIAWPDRAAAADGADELLLAGVPAGAHIAISGPSEQFGVADGGDIHLTFVLPGAYTVRLTLFPFQDEKGTIHAV